jgi:hypothetical protein
MDRAAGLWSKDPDALNRWNAPIRRITVPDREDLRDLEAILRPAIGSLSRARQSGLPSPADRDRLQSEAREPPAAGQG